MPDHLPQHLAALEEANRIRIAGAALRREIAAGKPVAEALADPRASHLTVTHVLRAQVSWGEDRTRKALLRAQILDAGGSPSERRRVRDLTEQQRERLLAAVDELQPATLAGRKKRL